MNNRIDIDRYGLTPPEEKTISYFRAPEPLSPSEQQKRIDLILFRIRRNLCLK